MNYLGNSNSKSFPELEPLYRTAHKTLISLLKQKNHKDSSHFYAEFSTANKNKIRITYYKKEKSGKNVRLFSKDYPFRYKAVMDGSIKPQVSSYLIKVNGKEIDLRSQKIYLDR